MLNGHRPRNRAAWGGDRGSAAEWTVVMVGVFALLILSLMTAVNFLAAQAASTAAQRALEVAQTPGYSPAETDSVAAQVATASGVVTGSQVEATTGAADTVSVQVRVRTVLGSDISRTAVGPRLRFVPQGAR